MAPDRNRARFHIKVVKKPARSGAAGNRPQCRRCASVCRFGAMLMLCGFAAGGDKMHWHGCAQQSMTDAAAFLASRVAAQGC